MKKTHRDKLDNELQIIVNDIIRNVKISIVSIILYGGYGRDEGSFFTDDNKQLRTYNDFDILIVLNKKISDKKIKSISNRILKKIDVRWLDISQITLKELPFLKPSIFNYDLKFGSRVIYGNENIYNLIPFIDYKSIGLKEAETLFFTRIWTFLGSLPKTAFNLGLKRDEAMFFRNQMSKAILSIVDVLLIQNNYYDSSYVQRVDMIKKLLPQRKRLIDLSDWALNEKLNPKLKKMDSEEVSSLYDEIANLFLNEMKIVLSKYYKRNIKSFTEIIRIIKFSRLEIVLMIKNFLKKRKIDNSYDFKIKKVQILLFEAYFKDKNERKLLVNKSKKIFCDKSTESFDWHDMRIYISKLRSE